MTALPNGQELAPQQALRLEGASKSRLQADGNKAGIRRSLVKIAIFVIRFNSLLSGSTTMARLFSNAPIAFSSACPGIPLQQSIRFEVAFAAMRMLFVVCLRQGEQITALKAMVRIFFNTQFMRFASVGGIATATQYVILYALVQGAAWDPAQASMFGAAISAVVNYWLNYTFSFKSGRRHRESFPLFVLMASCGTIMNGLIVKGLTLAGLYYMLAQVVATIVVLGFNFYVSRKWIFVQTK